MRWVVFGKKRIREAAEGAEGAESADGAEESEKTDLPLSRAIIFRIPLRFIADVGTSVKDSGGGV